MNKKVIKIAIQMRQNSYAPYSNYKVGSAVEVTSGEIIGGCNVESSSYGLTCCAERIALYNALSKGFKKFISIAVSTKNGGFPCGACRQVIWEICGEIPVYICDDKTLLTIIKSSILLPSPFNDKYLK
ncbi:MAG: cytidine deaminase [Candidatus Neomarinimicrobiota bacterium]|nr:cytidine deaminase [Candidatus Neomarinimicrobiota bacterium]|tara:strand:- start:1382 stop:1765 length:384 start_codon:yes stop_codon:yes gene_type:complete